MNGQILYSEGKAPLCNGQHKHGGNAEKPQSMKHKVQYMRAAGRFTLTLLIMFRLTDQSEPMDQAHISFQIHLLVILDVNNVTLSFLLPLALLPPMSLHGAMTQL